MEYEKIDHYNLWKQEEGTMKKTLSGIDRFEWAKPNHHFIDIKKKEMNKAK